MATVFLNGDLASTEDAATVIGGNTPDVISSNGALFDALLKGANNDDTIDVNLAGQNMAGGTLINGNQGDDSIYVYNTNPVLPGLEAPVIRNSSIFGGEGDDSIYIEDVTVGAGAFVRGNEGDDSIVFDNVDSNDAWVNGNQGDDTIDIFGSGVLVNTSINGGVGDDSITVDGELTGGWVRGDDGDDTIEVEADADGVLVNGNAGDDSIFVDSSFTNGTVRGGEGDDSIFFDSDSDVQIFGDAGDDSIFGSNGDDTINGGTGADRLDGNSGADTYVGVTGDSFAATLFGEDQVVFEDGVDVITGGVDDSDTFVINDVSFTAADLGTTVGFATIVDGDYVIEFAGDNPGAVASTFVVSGSFNSNTDTFSTVLGDDFLFFQVATPIGFGAEVSVTSVEALIIENFIPA